MKAQQARTLFVEFFARQDHARVASSPVIPHGDQTILFTNAGMNQFKDVFCGRETRPYTRAVTAQKCIRAGGKHNDLDNVGRTARHLTFFEMLGNFSFGDYFKKDAIRWAWDLLTGSYGLPADRLYATVFRDDDEAWGLWRDAIGLAPERIVRLGEKDNFWSMGDTGPCGPCSEILYDRGAQHSCGPECGIGSCDCDRFFEIWNLVFMQFDQAAGGARMPLPKPSIDTGMGLERLCMVLQGVDSVYETDLLSALIDKVAALSGRPYDRGKDGLPHRVIADHIRSLAFALADGAFPANDGRGYVLRRILRRAARYGRMLGFHEPVLFRLIDTVAELMGDAYGELPPRRAAIADVIRNEEERFGVTLDQGLARFAAITAELKAAQPPKRRIEATGNITLPSPQVSGSAVFLLHDTYGFPPDLTARMAEEEGFTVDQAEYEALMEAQRERSRSSAKFADVLAGGIECAGAPPTRFRGYDVLSLATEIVAAAELEDGRAAVVLAETPFYAEAGGQVGDKGVIEGPTFRITVEDTQKRGAHYLHIGALEGTGLAPGKKVTASVDATARAATQRHHTATHLLQAALRAELGTHVEQRGSRVAPDRLRFDFTHFAAVPPDTLRRVERHIAEAIVANKALSVCVVPIAEALAGGAMALFGEKYGEEVRVVGIPGLSTELCGGTHCARTGDIGFFRILSEGSVAAGVRRLEALAGPDALAVSYEVEDTLERCARALKTAPASLPAKIEALKEEIRALKHKSAQAGSQELDRGEERLGAITAAWRIYAGAGAEELRAIWDREKDRVRDTVLALFGRSESAVNLLVCLSPDLRGRKGLHAGKLAQAAGKAMGASGGGRPDMGQSGGKNPAAIKDAAAAFLAAARAQAAESA